MRFFRVKGKGAAKYGTSSESGPPMTFTVEPSFDSFEPIVAGLGGKIQKCFHDFLEIQMV